MSKLIALVLAFFFILLSGILLQSAYEAREEVESYKAQLVAFCTASNDAIKQARIRNISISTRDIDNEIVPFIYAENGDQRIAYSVFHNGKVLINLHTEYGEEIQEEDWGDFEIFTLIGKKN